MTGSRTAPGRRHGPGRRFSGQAWCWVLWLWQRLRDVKPVAWAAFVGPMLAGWGGFNLVEGVVDHHLLRVHHVRAGAGQLLWDLGFLVFGALLVAVGGARSGLAK